MQKIEGGVTTPMGFRAAGISAGLKANGDPDVALVVSDTACTAAAVFTQNRMQAAPVIFDRERLAENASAIRAVAINAKIANACTGHEGLADAALMAQYAESSAGLEAKSALVMSTGVIGHRLDLGKIQSGLAACAKALSVDGWEAASRAIMTTDTVPKAVAIVVDSPCGEFRIGGMAKGSGMIHPDMATMLGVLTTDVALDAERLAEILKRVCNRTFNRISVDGDTSTNDTVLLLANGASGIDIDCDLDGFEEALETVCRHLSRAVAADGEGATRLLDIRVSGTSTSEEAHRIANTIATSPLVKTAFFGLDANWGRVVAAAGRAGVPFSPDDVKLVFQAADGKGRAVGKAMTLMEGGRPLALNEEEARALLEHREIVISLEVGPGPGLDHVWSCDMSLDYVRINANYRT